MFNLRPSIVRICSVFLVGLVLLVGSRPSQAKPATAKSLENYIRYDELSQEISLSRLRAGNHDPSGVNDYIFRAQIFAVAILKEERKKDFKDRKKILRDLGEFSSTTLKSLSMWNKEDDPKEPLRIEGDLIRELAADAMRQFSLPENQISVLVRISMLEKNKQFMLFGEDLSIGEVDYYIIPETLPHRPDISRKNLTITDAQGVFAELLVNYDKLNKQQARN